MDGRASPDATASAQFGCTNKRGFSQTLSGDASNISSRHTKKRSEVILFPYFRNRLACDPLNFFCVYANHEYKWSDTAAEAERSIFALVDSMVAAARKAFNESLKHWRQMPDFVRQAHALCFVMSVPSAPMTGTTLHAYLNRDSFAHHLTTRKSVVSFSSAIPLVGPCNDVNAAFGGSVGRTTHSKGTLPRLGSRDRPEDEDEAVMKSLLQQWEPPQNGPKCRIVLDIIASRKTLGDDLPNSEPYRLGQKVFGFVKKSYPQEVMTTFVGISDSSVTLVGRDIIYPFRITGSAGAKSNTTPIALAGIRNTFTGSPAPVSMFTSADALGMTAATNMTATVSGVEQVLANTVPAPRMVAVPPVNTDKVDNVRLVVCFPPGDVTA
ncbi:hypothetical protein TraAM80_09681 [Trypanosoma rangeli]|uniref:Uncharacterized protein n=1 Tax=Trypanosoma rangeli TaxID=5698 RepID=A0A3R7KL86_TRYRA|nr:uncharacterized protein TraAM80_09681 [Trypanosoma rangeli]RNE96680.1 hypothetical protein TraAM80_09681 [Trypanosoma rangeli]|eukprot:RNE96680.1 hypothetical protein TraAM80_09681 [Trypanosoma rangeli]